MTSGRVPSIVRGCTEEVLQKVLVTGIIAGGDGSTKRAGRTEGYYSPFGPDDPRCLATKCVDAPGHVWLNPLMTVRPHLALIPI